VSDDDTQHARVTHPRPGRLGANGAAAGRNVIRRAAGAAVQRDVRPPTAGAQPTQEDPLSHELNLDAVDADGAIRASAQAVGLDRGDFIKKGALAGGGLIAGSAMFGTFLASAEAAISTTKRSAANDVKILNYALTLEFLEAAFYRQAVANKAYGASADLKRFAEVVAEHEANHVKFLRGALGAKAIKSPRFDFGDTVRDPAKFAATAQVLEDTGVSAYLGQVGNIFVKGTLAAAGTIATVEARHAAWIRFINKDVPAPKTFDGRKSEKAVLKAVGATGFIQ